MRGKILGKKKLFVVAIVRVGIVPGSCPGGCCLGGNFPVRLICPALNSNKVPSDDESFIYMLEVELMLVIVSLNE